MKQIIDSIIVLAATAIISVLFVLLIDHMVNDQIVFIQKLSDGDIPLLIMSVLYCILYPSIAMMAGGLVGFSLQGIGKWFKSSFVGFVTCSVIFGLSALYIMGSLWYQTVPIIWSNISWRNILLYTPASVTCLFDLSISIILAFGVYFYLYAENKNA